MRHGDAEQQSAGQISSGRGEQSAFQAYPAIESDIARRLKTPKRAAKAACNSRFSGQRHVVSGAPMWQAAAAIPPWTAGSALAGDRDVFAAAAAGAFLAAGLAEPRR